MKQLKQIRDDIAAVKAEIIRIDNSIPPVADIEALLRTYLTSLADPKRRLVDLAASILSHGTPVNELLNLPPTQLPQHAFGIALAAHGVDQIIAEAKTIAQTQDNGAMRLSADDRTDKLLELRRELYELELSEEENLADTPRRPDVNPAAVLGVPMNIAESNGYLTKQW
jgi:small-conductance mechanosensitive channel